MNDRDLQRAYTELLANRHAAGRGGCVSPEAIRTLVDREETEENRLRTLDHVMSCADCHREFELLRAVGEAVPRQRRFLVPGVLAAAATIALVAGSMWIGQGGSEQPVYRGKAHEIGRRHGGGDADEERDGDRHGLRGYVCDFIGGVSELDIYVFYPSARGTTPSLDLESGRR